MSELLTSKTPDSVAEHHYDRPAGVSFVAVVLAIGGVLLLAAQLMNLGRLSEASNEIGLPALLLQGGIAFLGLIGAASGVGLWLGRKWGWWAALFYFAYAVTRNVNVMISIPGLIEEFGAPQQELWTYYAKYSVRLAWNGAMLYYLCSEKPSIYFRTTAIKKWKAMLIVFAVCLFLFLPNALADG